MPVVMPSLASIDTVKAVLLLALLLLVIGLSFNCSHFSDSRARQMRPLPLVAIKFTISGVMASAAHIRSPSFSRSSSSRIMTILPFLSSAIISGISFLFIFQKQFFYLGQLYTMI